MQFIIIEWEVYNITQDPLALGFIGLVEIIPAISMALFAGHIVDQKEKNIICICNYFISSGFLRILSCNHRLFLLKFFF